MSTGTLAPARGTAQPVAGALFVIAAFEGKKIWRHPALIVASLITAYELYQQVDWANAPVLNRDSYTSAWPMIIYAAGVFLAIGMTVNQRHGAQADEAMDALPVSPLIRIFGTGLAFVSPLVLAMLMQGAVLFARALDGPVTSIVWAEALTGPATVALGAAAGMAVGWLFKAPFAVPLAGLCFLVATLFVWWNDFMFGRYTPWLAPVPALDRNQLALEQAYRPSEAHLAYVVLLTALFVTLSLLRGSRERRFVVVSLLIAVGLGVGATAVAQLGGLSASEEEVWRSAYEPSTAAYSCERSESVEYCSYPGYERWIEEWNSAIAPVLDLVPDDVAARRLEVVQQVPYFFDEPELATRGDITTGMWWSRGSYDPVIGAHQFGLSLAAAGWAVGIPTHRLEIVNEVVDGEFVPRPFDPERDPQDLMQLSGCSTDGQARAVAALWYAIQPGPEAREALSVQTNGEQFGGQSSNDIANIEFGGYRQPSSAASYFRRDGLVALDIDEAYSVGQASVVLTQHWADLIDPDTTTEDIAGWFGVEVPAMESFPEAGALACP